MIKTFVLSPYTSSHLFTSVHINNEENVLIMANWSSNIQYDISHTKKSVIIPFLLEKKTQSDIGQHRFVKSHQTTNAWWEKQCWCSIHVAVTVYDNQHIDWNNNGSRTLPTSWVSFTWGRWWPVSWKQGGIWRYQYIDQQVHIFWYDIFRKKTKSYHNMLSLEYSVMWFSPEEFSQSWLVWVVPVHFPGPTNGLAPRQVEVVCLGHVAIAGTQE